jgi:hypothetical protein
MGEELTDIELMIMHDLIAHTKKVKGAETMSRKENGECIELAKEIAAKIEERKVAV